MKLIFHYCIQQLDCWVWGTLKLVLLNVVGTTAKRYHKWTLCLSIHNRILTEFAIKFFSKAWIVESVFQIPNICRVSLIVQLTLEALSYLPLLSLVHLISIRTKVDTKLLSSLKTHTESGVVLSSSINGKKSSNLIILTFLYFTFKYSIYN